jgi:hypothetical protein
MKTLTQQFESSSDRLVADAKQKSKKAAHNPQKESRLVEVGD